MLSIYLYMLIICPCEQGLMQDFTQREGGGQGVESRCAKYDTFFLSSHLPLKMEILAQIFFRQPPCSPILPRRNLQLFTLRPLPVNAPARKEYKLQKHKGQRKLVGPCVGSTSVAGILAAHNISTENPLPTLFDLKKGFDVYIIKIVQSVGSNVYHRLFELLQQRVQPEFLSADTLT